MNKLNGALASLMIVGAIASIGAPEASEVQDGTTPTVVPAAFDVCYQEYRWCIADQNNPDVCYKQYLICEGIAG